MSGKQNNRRTVGTLGTEALGDGALGVGQARDLLLTLLVNNAVQSLDVGADNAATNTLPAALAGAARAVARVALAEEQAHTVGKEDTLLHRETLLVVTTADAKDVALPLVTEGVNFNVLRHTLVVEAAAGVSGTRTQDARRGTRTTSARP